MTHVARGPRAWGPLRRDGAPGPGSGCDSDSGHRGAGTGQGSSRAGRRVKETHAGVGGSRADLCLSPGGPDPGGSLRICRSRLWSHASGRGLSSFLVPSGETHPCTPFPGGTDALESSWALWRVPSSSPTPDRAQEWTPLVLVGLSGLGTGPGPCVRGSWSSPSIGLFSTLNSPEGPYCYGPVPGLGTVCWKINQPSSSIPCRPFPQRSPEMALCTGLELFGPDSWVGPSACTSPGPCCFCSQVTPRSGWFRTGFLWSGPARTDIVEFSLSVKQAGERV